MTRGITIKKCIAFFSCLIIAVSFAMFTSPGTSMAAAGLSLTTSSSSVQVGQTLTITVQTNTNGGEVTAFSGIITYPTNVFEWVRMGYDSVVCPMGVRSHDTDPTDGTFQFSCGRYDNLTMSGQVVHVILKAIAPANGSIGLSSCSALLNGTYVTGGCTGTTYTVITPGQATPPPNSTPTPAVSSTPLPTLKPTEAPAPTSTPLTATQALKGAETPQDNKNPPVQPVVPVTQHFIDNTPKIQDTPAPEDDSAVGTPERQTVSAAFQSLFQSFQEVKTVQKDTPGLIVVLISLIPFLLFALAAIFFLYRLYALEKRRRRSMDQLLELGLSEISSLEGKIDLLGEKGPDGIEQYKEEFKKAKENILGQLKPSKERKK